MFDGYNIINGFKRNGFKIIAYFIIGVFFENNECYSK